MAARPSCSGMEKFLPTPSARRATSLAWAINNRLLFLPTPSARRATGFVDNMIPALDISIHALREEGDGKTYALLLEGLRFLSTPSARRATCSNLTSLYADGISIHALREEGDTCILVCDFGYCSISIHALREEGDFGHGRHDGRRVDFYPRPPRGGRRRWAGPCTTCCYFYPRPPRGGRRAAPTSCGSAPAFLSTPSARRATTLASPYSATAFYFYPHPPRGGRHMYSRL